MSMRRLVTCVIFSTLAACSGGTLYTTLAGTSSAPPVDAYTCVAKQLETLEYRRTQYDTKAHFIIGEKRNEEDAGNGTTFRKTVDILEVYVKTGASGASDLTVKARTFDEVSNTRGVDRQERKSTNRALADARKLGLACAS
ncbi:MAG: hypothetical protein ABI587_00005 [Gemmatimonadales bacterium]